MMIKYIYSLNIQDRPAAMLQLSETLDIYYVSSPQIINHL